MSSFKTFKPVQAARPFGVLLLGAAVLFLAPTRVRAEAGGLVWGASIGLLGPDRPGMADGEAGPKGNRTGEATGETGWRSGAATPGESQGDASSGDGSGDASSGDGSGNASTAGAGDESGARGDDSAPGGGASEGTSEGSNGGTDDGTLGGVKGDSGDTTGEPVRGRDKPGRSGATSPGDARATPAAKPAANTGDDKGIVEFQPATDEEAAAAIAEARKKAAEVEKKLDIKLAEFETDHFIVFTNWDKREFPFLRTNLEAAYTCVSRQFGISRKKNVFVGKLPIYMIVKLDDFMRFADEIDSFNASRSVLGYYQGDETGSGHMAMWKPTAGGANNTARAEREWAYVLTHEFTHAFVARYRTNRQIPRWMNEGLAEVIAMGQFPDPDRTMMARTAPRRYDDLTFLFDDRNMPSGEYYPVMMSLVQTLLAEDRRKFLKMFNAIKDGSTPEDALQEFYHTDYDGLVAAWRRYAPMMGLR